MHVWEEGSWGAGGRDHQGAQVPPGRDGYPHYLYCSDDFIGVYLHENLLIVNLKCVQFLAYQLQLKKTVTENKLKQRST